MPPRRRRGNNAIPTAPGSTTPVVQPPPTATPSSSSGVGTPTSTSSGNRPPGRDRPRNGGDPNDPGGYRRKAGRRYLEQAENLEAQARALQRALKREYKGALRSKLQDVNALLKVQDHIVMKGYRERVKSLEGAASDNAKAAAGQSQLNQSNLTRERNSALGEAAMQGAGESDVLNAQMMSLRNWNANQSEVQRGMHDTLRSINSSLTDLNVDTRTARVNLQGQAQADKQMLWTNYYNQRMESLTQLGNIRGQQADYLDMAKEYGVGKGGNTKAAERAFMLAAKAAGEAWDSPGISKKLRRWTGRDDFVAPRSGYSTVGGAQTVRLDKVPEGATLRKW